MKPHRITIPVAEGAQYTDSPCRGAEHTRIVHIVHVPQASNTRPYRVWVAYR